MLSSIRWKMKKLISLRTWWIIWEIITLMNQIAININNLRFIELSWWNGHILINREWEIIVTRCDALQVFQCLTEGTIVLIYKKNLLHKKSFSYLKTPIHHSQKTFCICLGIRTQFMKRLIKFLFYKLTVHKWLNVVHLKKIPVSFYSNISCWNCNKKSMSYSWCSLY